jgi:phage replication initiation protein
MPLAGKGASCNTPPQITGGIKKPEQNQIVIDWLEFTMNSDFLYNNRYKSLKTYLKYEGAKFTHAPRGMHGYKAQMFYGKCRILYDGTDDMGVHVILSGDAIRDMNGCILNFLHWILHHEGRISRIDIALDDVSNLLQISKVKNHIRNGHLVSRSKQFRYMQSGKVSNGAITGETVYFGSPQSRTQYRIYDKALETGIDAGPWIRCEGQYRNENAQAVAKQIHESGMQLGSVFTGLLRGFLKFLKPSETINKTRWQVVKWWDALLINTQSLKLAVQKSIPSMERALNWFNRQIAPTFAQLLNYYGPGKMREYTSLGWKRLTDEQKRCCKVPF